MVAKSIMKVIGSDGQIELMSDRVVITRAGLWNVFKYGFNTKKEIPLSAITTVNFRDANALRFGEIDFSYAGRSQFDAKQNMVIFSRKHQEEFIALKEAIFELMEEHSHYHHR